MVLELITLIVSVAFLARASSLVVENLVKISKFFNISQIAVGFVLLAVATSIPELSVSVVSSSMGAGAIAAGNVFGSNIANILLVLGLGAFVYGLKIRQADLREIGLVLLLTTIISVYILFNSSVRYDALGFLEGLLLLCVFIGYVIYSMRKKKIEENGANGAVTKKDALAAFLYFGAGIIIVIISSGFVVDSAVAIARNFGIAESFIGATIIAVGTSLPELSIDLQAIRKKHYGIALGDAIGSNMTNLTLVLGTAAAINPIHVAIPVFVVALLFAVVANMLLLYFGAVNRGIGKLGGALFLGTYAVYIIVIFVLQANEIALPVS